MTALVGRGTAIEGWAKACVNRTETPTLVVEITPIKALLFAKSRLGSRLVNAT